MLSLTLIYCYAECHYAKCLYAECSYAAKKVKINKIILKIDNIYKLYISVKLLQI